VNDAVARERARTVFDHPLVVEAGAGTGKTTTLIARLCTWCVGPGWDAADTGGKPDVDVAADVLDGVVAITFTEAAAAEMAGRFGAALVDLAAGRSVIGVPDLPVEAPVAEARARALLGAVDRLTVSTIHAFCGRVLAAAPTLAGLHPGYVVDADGSLLAEHAQEVVVDWFTEVFGNDAGGTDVVARDHLMALATEGVGVEAIGEALVALASAAVPPQALAEPFDSEAEVDSLLADLDAAVAAVLEVVRPPLAEAAGSPKVARHLAGTFELADALEHLRAATTGRRGRAALREAVARLPGDAGRLREWARKGSSNDTERRVFEGYHRSLKRAATPLVGLLGHLGTLDPSRLEAARHVLGALLARLQEALDRSGVVSFSHLLVRARDLLRDHADVRRRLRGNLTQLLVDEFQDTDDLQCDLVRMLALEGSPRPGLFVVGDPKQSIYGWRSADLVAYDRFVDEVLPAGGERVRLDVNRRSLPPILEEVERVCAPAMLPEVGYQPEFQALVPHRAGEAPGGVPGGGPWACVEHWYSNRVGPDGSPEALGAGDVATLEARAIAADLRRLHDEAGLSWEKVGILLRSTTDLDRYLDALRRAGVPYVVERDRQYFRRRDIIDAVALVRCIFEPADALALLTVLRSPLVGVPDAALLPLWRGKLPEAFAELSDADPVRITSITMQAALAAREARASGVEGIERVDGWEALLSELAGAVGWLRAAYGTLPADHWVEHLRRMLPLEILAASRHLGEYRLANLQRFYLDLEEALSASPGDPHGVVRALRTGVAGQKDAEEARPADATEKAVRVMTIHKAKGLDFDHVYLVQLHKGRRGGGGFASGGTKTQARHFDGRWQVELLGARSLGYSAVAAHDEKVEHLERVRLLYVAMTRARDRLVLLGRRDKAERRSPEEAESFLELLLNRKGGTVPLTELGPLRVTDQGGARWRLVDDAPPETLGARERTRTAPNHDIAARRARMDRLQAAAAARMARPVSERASDAAHRVLEEQVVERKAVGTAGPSVGAAVGTAVHKVLELIDPTAPAAEWTATADRVLGRELAGLLPEEQVEEAYTRARALVDRFVGGALGARMRVVGRHIVARELPTLSAPAGDQGPVGFVAGAIDMVYRDPHTTELVVVDYKTDAVPTAEALAERIRAYRLQADYYGRVLRDALGLATLPRTELWFLSRDEVVPL